MARKNRKQVRAEYEATAQPHITAYLREQMEAAGRFALRAVRPLHIPSDNGSYPIAIGSAVLLRHRGIHFVVTAAHVMEPYGDAAVYLGTQTRWPELPRPFMGTDGGKADNLDFAFRPITHEFAASLDGCEFLDTSSIVRADPITFDAPNRSKYLAVGFPQNQFEFDPSVKRTNAPALSYLGTIASPEQYSALGVQPDSHIVVHYDTEETIGPTGIQTPPSIVGISGGGMFRLRSVEAPNDMSPPMLAAISIEHRKKHSVMLGVRIDVVVAGINLKFDRLNEFFPFA